MVRRRRKHMSRWCPTWDCVYDVPLLESLRQLLCNKWILKEACCFLSQMHARETYVNHIPYSSYDIVILFIALQIHLFLCYVYWHR